MTNKLILTLLLLTSFATLKSQTFSGIFEESEAELKYLEQTGWDAFLADHDQQVAQGFRLIDIESSRVDGDERIYYGIYTESNLRDSVGMGLNWSEFVALKRKMAEEDYLMVDLHAFSLNEVDRQYIGVWVKQELEHKIRSVSTRANLAKEIKSLGRRRYKLKRVHVVETPQGVPEYVALFHHSPAQEYNYLQFTTDRSDFARDMQERRESGVNLIDYASFLEDGERYFLGVYQKARYEYQFKVAENRAALEKEGEALKKEGGLHLVNMNVY